VTAHPYLDRTRYSIYSSTWQSAVLLYLLGADIGARIYQSQALKSVSWTTVCHLVPLHMSCVCSVLGSGRSWASVAFLLRQLDPLSARFKKNWPGSRICNCVCGTVTPDTVVAALNLADSMGLQQHRYVNIGDVRTDVHSCFVTTVLGNNKRIRKTRSTRLGGSVHTGPLGSLAFCTDALHRSGWHASTRFSCG